MYLSEVHVKIQLISFSKKKITEQNKLIKKGDILKYKQYMLMYSLFVLHVLTF